MFEDKCVWSALYPISNHSHIRQLQFATHAFSQQVLQQAVQISICQWTEPLIFTTGCFQGGVTPPSPHPSKGPANQPQCQL